MDIQERMASDRGFLYFVLPTTRELFWDRNVNFFDPDTEIERVINLGGSDYLAEIQKKYDLEKFISVLMKFRNFSRMAVNYWCLVLRLDREKSAAFRDKDRLWFPLR